MMNTLNLKICVCTLAQMCYFGVCTLAQLCYFACSWHDDRDQIENLRCSYMFAAVLFWAFVCVCVCVFACM